MWNQRTFAIYALRGFFVFHFTNTESSLNIEDMPKLGKTKSLKRELLIKEVKRLRKQGLTIEEIRLALDRSAGWVCGVLK